MAEVQPTNDETNPSNFFQSCFCGDFSGGESQFTALEKVMRDSQGTKQKPDFEGQVLEVEDNEAMEMSVITDDYMYDVSTSLAKTIDVIKPRSKTNRDSYNFGTPSKKRNILKEVPTPETVGTTEDCRDESDQNSQDSKLQCPNMYEMAIRVDDYESETFRKVLELYQDNPNLLTVEVCRLREISNKRTRTAKEMALFFATLRSLPRLNELILYNFNELDLDLICSMVKDHPTLRKLHIHFTSGAVDKTLLEILSEAPVLEKITIDVQSTFPLADLLSSKTLTRVIVLSETFHFSEEHLVSAMQVLEKNETLLELDLKPKLSNLGLRSLAFGIEDNKRLETIKFSYLENEKEAGRAFIDLAHSISRNKSLVTVKNHYSDLLHVSRDDIFRILDILECNQTLRQFEVFDDVTAVRQLNSDDDTECDGGLLSKWMCDAIPEDANSKWRSLSGQIKKFWLSLTASRSA